MGSWQIISPSPAVGYVKHVETLRSVMNVTFDRPTVIVAGKVGGDEEIPSGRGVSVSLTQFSRCRTGPPLYQRNLRFVTAIFVLVILLRSKVVYLLYHVTTQVIPLHKELSSYTVEKRTGVRPCPKVRWRC